VTVRVDQRTDSPHNLGKITETVLLFWASNSGRYTGFAVEFELVETGTPDVVLVYADGPEAWMSRGTATACWVVRRCSDRTRAFRSRLSPGSSPGPGRSVGSG
jgi:hypothetical protein